MTERTGCEARQYSDQRHCAKCGKCWDTNDDDPPECRRISTPQVEQNGPNPAQKLLERLGL